MTFQLRIALMLLKVGMAFVPQQKYEERIAEIVPMEQKVSQADLGNWEYRAIQDSSTGFTHRYFYLPSAVPDAPVLLLFHGLTLDGRTFANLTDLSQKYQLIAYDFPEQTDRYKGSLDDFMGIVDEFTGLLGLEDAYLGGVSFGGAIAVRLAARKTGFRGKSLILISTGLMGSTRKERRDHTEIAQWVSRQPDYKLYWFMEKLYNRSRRKHLGANDTLQALNDLLRVKHPDYYRQVGLAMEKYGSAQELKGVTCPVLWLMGDEDNVFSEDQKKLAQSYVPQAQFQIVKGGEHSMVFTQGAEVSRRILAFCESSCAPN